MPAPYPSTAQLTIQEWEVRLGKVHSDAALAGYWDTLAANCQRWADEISVGSAGTYWGETVRRLDLWRADYRRTTASDLLPEVGLPKFQSKTSESIRRKLFDRYKRDVEKAIAPIGAPIPQLNDLVRTRVVCKYLDGVEFMATKL